MVVNQHVFPQMSWLFPYACHHPVRWGGGRGGTTEEPVARLARTLATALVTADEEEGDLTKTDCLGGLFSRNGECKVR